MRNKRPELKQAWDMSLADFERYPVWIGVHGVDESEWWYEKTDEATYRPWTDPLPISPEGLNLLVWANMQLFDGSCYDGYFCPLPLNWATAQEPQLAAIGEIAGKDAPIGDQQPAVFIAGKAFSFWGGIAGIPLARRKAFYSAVGLPPEKVFPLRFAAKPGLVSGIVDGTVYGFYRLVKKNGHLVGEIQNDGKWGPNGTFVDSAGRSDEVGLEASHLTAEPPPPDLAKQTIYAKVALTEYLRTLECDPSNRQLYGAVCRTMLFLKDYEGALAYSDAGMAAVGGSAGSRVYDGENLTYCAARALFELGRYQEALDRAETLLPVWWRSIAWSKSDGPLLTQKGLVKACKSALKRQDKERKI
ncbi:MAG: hypothetical protein ABI822_05210 [Bryobacteraceae bacterium]